jgi:hypothetical protein
VDSADERRKRRAATWTSQVYRGDNVHRRIEDDDLAEWAAMAPVDRLALAFALSFAQSAGGLDEAQVSARLPRSAFRVERR